MYADDEPKGRDMNTSSEKLRRVYTMLVFFWTMEFSSSPFRNYLMKICFLLSKIFQYFLGAQKYYLEKLASFIEFHSSRKSSETFIRFSQSSLNNLDTRAVIVWAKECKFRNTDLFLVQHIFSNFDGQKIIVVNCDCEKLDWHFPAEWFAFTLFVRRNLGYDWGAYRFILNQLQHSLPSSVTIINNSVIALSGESKWISKQETLATSIKGIAGAVESNFPKRHNQSFSLTFTKDSLEKGILKWIQGMPTLNRKASVVRYYEIGLSLQCKKLGVPTQSLISDAHLRRFALENWQKVLAGMSESEFYKKVLVLLSRDLSMNPTHHLWRFVVSSGLPLAKKSLLEANPLNVPDIRILQDLASTMNRE